MHSHECLSSQELSFFTHKLPNVHVSMHMQLDINYLCTSDKIYYKCKSSHMNVLVRTQQCISVPSTHLLGDVYFFSIRHSAAAMKSSYAFCLFSKIASLCHWSPYSLHDVNIHVWYINNTLTAHNSYWY